MYGKAPSSFTHKKLLTIDKERSQRSIEILESFTLEIFARESRHQGLFYLFFLLYATPKKRAATLFFSENKGLKVKIKKSFLLIFTFAVIRVSIYFESGLSWMY